MKIKIVADRAVFNGKTYDVIEVSAKKKPINQSSFLWWIEDYFEDGYWALCRPIANGEIVELRFKAVGYHREIEEIKGVVSSIDEPCYDFLFSAIEI